MRQLLNSLIFSSKQPPSYSSHEASWNIHVLALKNQMLICIDEKGKSNMAENPRPRKSEDIQQCIQQTKDSTPHPEKRKLHDIVSSLRNSDHSLWKPIKSRRKPRLQVPPIRKNTTPTAPWAKSDDDKVKLFASHLAEVYTPNLTPPIQKEKACSPTTQNT